MFPSHQPSVPAFFFLHHILFILCEPAPHIVRKFCFLRHFHCYCFTVSDTPQVTSICLTMYTSNSQCFTLCIGPGDRNHVLKLGEVFVFCSDSICFVIVSSLAKDDHVVYSTFHPIIFLPFVFPVPILFLFHLYSSSHEVYRGSIFSVSAISASSSSSSSSYRICGVNHISWEKTCVAGSPK